MKNSTLKGIYDGTEARVKLFGENYRITITRQKSIPLRDLWTTTKNFFPPLISQYFLLYFHTYIICLESIKCQKFFTSGKPREIIVKVIDTFWHFSTSLQRSTLLLNEGIPRALKGKKLRLKNILLLPLIFEEMNSF